MTLINHIIRIIPPIMMPIQRQIVPRHNFNRVPRCNVAENVTAQVYGAQVFDGTVVVAAFAGWAIVGGDADPFEGALVDAVDVDALVGVSERWKVCGVMSYPDECVCSDLGGEKGESDGGEGEHDGGWGEGWMREEGQTKCMICCLYTCFQEEQRVTNMHHASSAKWLWYCGAIYPTGSILAL